MPPLRIGDLDPHLNWQDEQANDRNARVAARRHRRPNRSAAGLPESVKRQRPDGRESFKCGRCRTFVGPTISGGRHRNHCPLCLTSRHVDDRHPGDRASECRALMDAVGVFARPKGEQVIVHRCGGCGLERHNRVAADDNSLALLRLPPVPPRLGGRRKVAEEAIA